MERLGSSFIAAVTRKSSVFLNKKTSNCVRNPEKAGLYRFRNNGWKPQNCTGTVLVIIVSFSFSAVFVSQFYRKPPEAESRNLAAMFRVYSYTKPPILGFARDLLLPPSWIGGLFV